MGTSEISFFTPFFPLLPRPPASMACASPELGEHTEEVLKEIGYGEADLAQLKKDKVI